MIEALTVGQLYSNEEIYKSLAVSNAGGVRLSLREKAVVRAVIMTSVQDLHGVGENPYQDRLEGDILAFTAAGKLGEQTLAGANQRLIEQKLLNFPIHAFVLIARRRDKAVGPRRWKYLGLLEYLRHYPDTQLGADRKIRKVWLFEFRIHRGLPVVPIVLEAEIFNDVLRSSRLHAAATPDDDEIVDDGQTLHEDVAERVEDVRSRLLRLEPRNFEIFIKDLLLHCGFVDVCTKQLRSDDGID